MLLGDPRGFLFAGDPCPSANSSDGSKRGAQGRRACSRRPSLRAAAVAITAEESADACYGWLFPLGRAGNIPLATHKITSSSKINNGLCTTQPHARGLSQRPRSSERRERESPVGTEQPWLCCSIRALCTESKCCRATTDREFGSFCTVPQCHRAPPGLSSGSTNGSVPSVLISPFCSQVLASNLSCLP